MPLINRKIHLELNWSNDCIMSTTDETTFKIKNTKLYVPIVTLSNKDNAKLVKLLEDGFNRLVYWNKHTKQKKQQQQKKNRIKKFRQQQS